MAGPAASAACYTRLCELYRDYIALAEEGFHVSTKNRLERIFTNTREEAPAHAAFFRDTEEAVNELATALAAEPDGQETAAEAVRLILAEHAESLQSGYMTLVAAEQYAAKLIPYLTNEARTAILEWYQSRFRSRGFFKGRLTPLPIQKKILQQLAASTESNQKSYN